MYRRQWESMRDSDAAADKDHSKWHESMRQSIVWESSGSSSEVEE
jgi:hypothetical protein